MRTGLILFLLAFFAVQHDALAAVTYKRTVAGDCRMVDEGRLMRTVRPDLCVMTGEGKTSFSSLDNSPREAVKEAGRAPSLETFYRRKATAQ